MMGIAWTATSRATGSVLLCTVLLAALACTPVRPGSSGAKPPVSEDCQPTLPEIFSALIALQFYADHPGAPTPTGQQAIMAQQIALNLLRCDQSFGWQRRRLFIRDRFPS